MDELRVRVARAMHERHRVSGPAYDDMSEGFQNWMLEQADAALEVIAADLVAKEGY